MFRALASSSALGRLHDARRAELRDVGERSWSNLGVTFTLLCLAAVLLVAVAWVPTDMQSYFESRDGIETLDFDQAGIVTTQPSFFRCSLGQNCRERMLKTLPLREFDSVAIDSFQNDSPNPVKILMRLQIPRQAYAEFTTQHIVTALPRYRYDRAEVFLNGRHYGQFFSGKWISVTAPLYELEDVSQIDVVMEFLPSSKSIAGVRNYSGILIASSREFRQFENYLAAKSASAVGSMGHLAKIVLALFCLLLFLLVDSSPESLGLALFMGFEALAMGISQGWLPLGWLGLGHATALSNFCYQMGDILKLYFLLQIARVAPPRVGWWLVVGACLSLPYGFFMEAASTNNINWVFKIPRTRDTFVGLVGMAFCLRAAWGLRDRALPWRKTALIIAAVAGGFEVINSWIAHSSLFGTYPSVKSLFTILQANTGYLFALSTFLNISTLENRVRVLTAEFNRSAEIKRQMEIGRSVQRAFLQLPDLPPQLGLSCHHEAAVYVSGDTYFVFYDRNADTLTFLLNDVTGHGVQAALKAFASNTIAKTLWTENSSDDQERRRKDRRKQPSRLAKYDDMIDRLLCQTEAVPDFNAMVGAEFDLENETVSLYRANYNFPIVVEPCFDWYASPGSAPRYWNVKILPLPNREVVEMKFVPGSLLLLISDGFIEDARREADLARYLDSRLNMRGSDVDARGLEDLALAWASERNLKRNDDRTLLAFQWDPLAASRYRKSAA